MCAAHVGLGPGVLVLYDVTTLYFETDAGDGFREPGFSKERRLEPQITVGLLTDAAGFPLAMKESAGKAHPGATGTGNEWLTRCWSRPRARPAGCGVRTTSPSSLLGSPPAGVRNGPRVAVAHSMLVSAYYMLQRDQPYHELGPDWHSRRNNEAPTRRLVQQPQRLGHTVILDPAVLTSVIDTGGPAGLGGDVGPGPLRVLG